MKTSFYYLSALLILLSGCRIDDPEKSIDGADYIHTVQKPLILKSDGVSKEKVTIELLGDIRNPATITFKTSYGSLDSSLYSTDTEIKKEISIETSTRMATVFITSSYEYEENCILQVKVGDISTEIFIPVTSAYPDDFFIEAPSTLDTTGSVDVTVHLFRNLGKATNSIKADFDTINTSAGLSITMPEFAYSSDTIIKAQINTIDSDTGSFDFKVSIPLNGGGVLAKIKHFTIH